jgi:hypothetical protein
MRCGTTDGMSEWGDVMWGDRGHGQGDTAGLPNPGALGIPCGVDLSMDGGDALALGIIFKL